MHAEVREGERNAHRLTTTWLPEYDVRATTAPTVGEQDLLKGLEQPARSQVRPRLQARQAGAGGLLSGKEPAAAFTAVAGVQLWHWARDASATGRSRQHAKIAVADRRILFLGSANLTESAALRNMEAGVLVRGGDAPQRAAEHMAELQRTGVLRPLGTA
ncbi:phospholipase D-like domain-containing protein [Streptomyces sp. NPDC006283]|uniref:phospholipase D-like domain-containing protein n=1 Tax=Streptomyces sp. NPDC006283 TaxID=3156741 RepID=UPI0033BEDEBD